MVAVLLRTRQEWNRGKSVSVVRVFADRSGSSLYSPVGVRTNFHSAGNQYREHSGVVVYNQNNDFNQAYTQL